MNNAYGRYSKKACQSFLRGVKRQVSFARGWGSGESGDVFGRRDLWWSIYRIGDYVMSGIGYLLGRSGFNAKFPFDLVVWCSVDIFEIPTTYIYAGSKMPLYRTTLV
ncbi:hypothetical protein CUMW_025360 [Citrus unshiu]|nr:hypothetical protein CUMW_025360 [Citrus unshiu]